MDGPYDAQVVQQAVTINGCKPALLEIGNETKLCETLEDLKNFYVQLTSNDMPHPCTEIQSMNEWQDEELISDNSSTLVIEINFVNDIYKEFIYLKAYSMESLIGNAGGYIGKYNAVFCLPYKLKLLFSSRYTINY